jgi:4-hydroxythreonine-4-phosphate dehydrogenase
MVGAPRMSVVGITLGDPSGIGPEIVATSLAAASPTVRRRVVVYGDRGILERGAAAAGVGPQVDVTLIEAAAISPADAPPGQPTVAGGVAQVAWLEAAAAAAGRGELAGLVTAPISKASARRAGFGFPGHTEFLADRLGAPRVAMMLAGPRLKVVLATIHLPLAAVPAALEIGELAATIELAAGFARRDLGLARPRIGVLGLNPHAGEEGLIGREELDVIAPAIARAAAVLGDRCELVGPLVPDAAYRQPCDVFVAMYHDQGLIPVKLLDFEQAVNVTLGLPIVRTSPDHGVAYDIAGTGRARATSFTAALDLCLTLVDRRASIK